VVAARRPRLEEALDRLPAHPDAAALAVRRVADRVLAELLEHVARGRLALAHVDDLALEERRLREAEALQRRPVRRAEHLVAHREDVARLDGVHEDAHDARRLDVAAVLEARPDPVALLGELEDR